MPNVLNEQVPGWAAAVVGDEGLCAVRAVVRGWHGRGARQRYERTRKSSSSWRGSALAALSCCTEPIKLQLFRHRCRRHHLTASFAAAERCLQSHVSPSRPRCTSQTCVVSRARPNGARVQSQQQAASSSSQQQLRQHLLPCCCCEQAPASHTTVRTVCRSPRRKRRR